MISGFLTSVNSPLRPRQCYRGTPYVDYYHHLLLPVFGTAFDKRTNRVSTDVADKHARYTSEIATSPASRRSRMN